MAINKFVRNSYCYNCISCNRLTRKTGHDSDNTIMMGVKGLTGTCSYCYDMGSIENLFSDSGLKYPTEKMVDEWEELIDLCLAAGGEPCVDFRKHYKKECLNDSNYLTVKELRAMLFEIENEDAWVLIENTNGILSGFKKFEMQSVGKQKCVVFKQNYCGRLQGNQ